MKKIVSVLALLCIGSSASAMNREIFAQNCRHLSIGIASMPLLIKGTGYFLYGDNIESKLPDADPMVTKLVHAQLRTMGVKNYDAVAVKCGRGQNNVFASSRNAIFIPKEEHDFLKDYSTCAGSTKALRANKSALGFHVAKSYAAQHKKPFNDIMIPVCLSGAPEVILEHVAQDNGKTLHEELEDGLRKPALGALASVEHEAGHIANGDVQEAMISCFVIPPLVHASANVAKQTLKVRPFKSYAGMLAGTVVGGYVKKEMADVAFYGVSRHQERRADAGVLLVKPLRDHFRRSLSGQLEAIIKSSDEPMTLEDAFIRYKTIKMLDLAATHPGLHERIEALDVRLEQQRIAKLAQEAKENS